MAFNWEDQPLESEVAQKPSSSFKWEDQPLESDTSMLESGARGLHQGVTAFTQDEIAGLGAILGDTAYDWTHKDIEGDPETDLSDLYTKTRDEARQTNSMARESNPWTYGTTEFLGSLAPAIATGGAGEISSLANAVKIGSAQGGLMSAGSSDADLVNGDGDDLKDFLIDTTLGTAIGGGAGAAGYGASKLIPKNLRETIQNFANRKAVKAVGGERGTMKKILGKDVSQKQVDDLGQRILDNDIITPFGTTDDIAENMNSLESTGWSEMKEGLKQADAEAPMKVDPFTGEKTPDGLISPYKLQHDIEEAIQGFDEKTKAKVRKEVAYRLGKEKDAFVPEFGYANETPETTSVFEPDLKYADRPKETTKFFDADYEYIREPEYNPTSKAPDVTYAKPKKPSSADIYMQSTPTEDPIFSNVQAPTSSPKYLPEDFDKIRRFKGGSVKEAPSTKTIFDIPEEEGDIFISGGGGRVKEVPSSKTIFDIPEEPSTDFMNFKGGKTKEISTEPRNLTLEDAQKLKNSVKDMSNWNSINPSTQDNAFRKVEEIIKRNIDEGVTDIGGNKLLSSGRSKYRTAAQIQPMVLNKAAREAGNKSIGLTDWILLSFGLGEEGGFKVPAVYAAKKYGEQYGNQQMALMGNRVAKLLQSKPHFKKYLDILKQAGQRGSQPLASTVYVLNQQSPEFRDMQSEIEGTDAQ